MDGLAVDMSEGLNTALPFRYIAVPFNRYTVSSLARPVSGAETIYILTRTAKMLLASYHTVNHHLS